jgi:hypothetical protein
MEIGNNREIVNLTIHYYFSGAALYKVGFNDISLSLKPRGKKQMLRLRKKLSG